MSIRACARLPCSGGESPPYSHSGSLQKRRNGDAGLFDDGAQRAFRHIARMIGKRGIALSPGVESYLMGAGGLTIKLEPQLFQTLDNLTILKAREPPHC